MANMNAYKEGSAEWYGQLLDFLSRSTYDAIVQRQSEDKIMGQLNDSYQLLLNLRSDYSFRKNEPIRKSAMKQSNYLRSLAEYVVSQTGNATLDALIWKYRLLEAQSGCLDSYFLYLEKNRDPEKRFYEPRRQKFLQFEIVQSMESLIHGDLDILSVSMPPGTGKLISADCPVLTRNGWKKHGELTVGDEVVSPNGEFVKVLRRFADDYADVEMTFANGEVIYCHENHEWLMYDKSTSTERLVETKYLMRRKIDAGTPGKRGHRFLFNLPKKQPMLGDKHSLPVNPYVFGVWLGDGTAEKPTVTVCNDDMVIASEIEKHYKRTTTFEQIGCKAISFEGLRGDLNKMGMCRTRQRNYKWIPDTYLTASLEDRLELLAGMLDTDGTLDCRKQRYLYSTTSETLRDDFISLVSTFGWRCCVNASEPKLSTSGIQGKKTVYVIGFNPTFEIPCRVERKKLTAPKTSKTVALKSIRRVEPRIGNCIQVEGGMYCVGRTMLPTHNSTAGIFLLSGVMGWWPSEPNLASAHSGILTRSFYDGVSQILSDADEYAWHEIFPDVRFDPRYGTNSKEQTIDVGNMKRFKSLTCRAINASLTGATRAERLLYADDLCSGIEEALSKERMDKLWQTYNTDLKTRKKQFCKEIHIATRWSIQDVCSRLEREHEGDPRAKFIKIPALNADGESNFEYAYGVGFDTKYFVDMRNSMDDVSFRCLFMNDPIEREGRLYDDNELRRYLQLPLQKPDTIRCIVDTKNKGTDYFFQPVFYVYGEDHYLVDCICSDESNYEIQYERSAQLLLSWKVDAARFESNNGGDRVSFEVDKRIKAAKGYCNITQAYTEQNKETKIILYAPWVKQHVIFKDKSMYDPKSPYGVMMSFLMSYTVAGKNKHDDVPDGLASYAKWIARPDAKPSAIIMSPF